MRTVSSFSPGKVLLSGEHSVVYGYPALALPIDVGVEVVVEPTKGKGLEVISNHEDSAGIIRKAYELVGRGKAVRLTIKSDLPIGSGLGSSAAVASACIKALARFNQVNLTKQQLFGLVMECERLAHGNPSGVDPAVVVNRAMIEFVRGRKPIIHRLQKQIKLVLVQSGRPVESTKEMVELVADYMSRNPGNKYVLDKLGEVTLLIKDSLMSGDDLTDLFILNGELLEELGVASERTRDLSNGLRRQGLGVKITGAGGKTDGSGMLIVYHADEERLINTTEKLGLEMIEVSVGE